MFNIKNFGMGIGLSAVAAMMLTNQANGMINVNRAENSSYSSYESDDYDYDDYENDELEYDEDDETDYRDVAVCRIYKYNVDNFFDDDDILKDYTMDYLDRKLEVYNLDTLSTNSSLGIGFSNGIYVTDSYVEPEFCKYVVNCDEDDFEDFKESFDFSWREEDSNDFYYYDDDGMVYNLSYYEDIGIMIYTEMYGVAG